MNARLPERARAGPGSPASPAPLTARRRVDALAAAAQWFAKARRQGQLALNRAKSLKYDPLEDPKYSFDEPDDDDEDEDEEEEDE